MHYRLDREIWQEQMDSIAHQANHGDLIFVPSIMVLNEMTKRLVEFRPGVLVYVRIERWRYFPRVGEEMEVEL